MAQRLLGLGSKEETLKYLLPEQKPKTVVQKVTSAVNSVTPTLNKKVTKEETSDEAVLADDSEWFRMVNMVACLFPNRGGAAPIK